MAIVVLKNINIIIVIAIQELSVTFSDYTQPKDMMPGSISDNNDH